MLKVLGIYFHVSIPFLMGLIFLIAHKILFEVLKYLTAKNGNGVLLREAANKGVLQIRRNAIGQISVSEV